MCNASIMSTKACHTLHYTLHIRFHTLLTIFHILCTIHHTHTTFNTSYNLHIIVYTIYHLKRHLPLNMFGGELKLFIHVRGWKVRQSIWNIVLK